MISNGGIFNHRTLTIMLTYRCTSACSHCGTFSTPKDKTEVSIEAVCKAIDEAQKLGFLNVVFTGGEATLYMENLLQGIKYAKERKFPVRLVTNAHWAWSIENTQKVLHCLIEAGLDEINFSTGDEHLKFVPIENIYNAVSVATELEFTNLLMYEERDNSNVSKEIIENTIIKLTDEEKRKKWFKIISSPWMPLDYKTKSFQASDSLANHTTVTTKTGCESILNTYVLQGDGKIASCCGLGIRHIPELHPTDITEENFLLKAIEESESDWIKIALRQLGPEKILAWASSKNPNIQWENMYNHTCQSCIRLYKDDEVKSTVLQHFDELKIDLLSTIIIDKKIEKQLRIKN